MSACACLSSLCCLPPANSTLSSLGPINAKVTLSSVGAIAKPDANTYFCKSSCPLPIQIQFWLATSTRHHHFNRVSTRGSGTRGWSDQSLSHTCYTRCPDQGTAVHISKPPICNYCTIIHPFGTKFRYVFAGTMLYQFRLVRRGDSMVLVTSFRPTGRKKQLPRLKSARYPLSSWVVRLQHRLLWFGAHPMDSSASPTNIQPTAPGRKMDLGAMGGISPLIPFIDPTY